MDFLVRCCLAHRGRGGGDAGFADRSRPRNDLGRPPDGFLVNWQVDRLDVTRAGKRVLSFNAIAAREWSRVREGADSQALRMEKTYAVLSAVGPWLSVQGGTFCDCGGAHPTAVLGFYTYDLRKIRPDSGASADLASIFPADVILAALLHNDTIAGVLNDAGVVSPRTLPELLKALAFKTTKFGDCNFSFDDALLSSFAFHHIEGDKVAVRFGLPPEAQVCRGQLTQIEILLPVGDATRSAARCQGRVGAVDGESRRHGRWTDYDLHLLVRPGHGRN